jgi:hypothetical protein
VLEVTAYGDPTLINGRSTRAVVNENLSRLRSNNKANELIEVSRNYEECSFSEDDVVHLLCGAQASYESYMGAGNTNCLYESGEYQIVFSGRSFENDVSRCYIMKNIHNDYIVAYRGTEMGGDYYADSLFLQPKVERQYGSVQIGFDINDDQCVPFVNSQLNINSILFTGHSLGGAIAAIQSVKFGIEHHQDLNGKINCITFGQPMTGDEKFVEKQNEYTNYYRVKNDFDIVPTEAAMALGYKHNNHLLIVLLGNIVKCGHRDIVPSSSVEDHSMRTYLNKIRSHLT